MKKITLISLACFGFTALSASAGNLKTELAQCAQVTDSLARLVCYDDLVKTTSLPNVSEKAPTVAVPKAKAVPVAPALSKEERFGAEHLKKTNVTEADLQVVFVVDKLKKDQYGKWRFTFKNGQQWKQTDDDYFQVKVGEKVLLKKGFMGAIYLKKTDPSSNRKVRVKRMK